MSDENPPLTHQAPLLPEGKLLISLITDAYDPWGDYINLRIGIRTADKVLIADPLRFTEHEPNIISPSHTPACFVFNKRQPETLAALQHLMNRLWELGIRPTDVGSPGELSATKTHLADMRSLVAKTIGVTLP